VHGVDDVSAGTQRFQDFFGTLRDIPAPRLGLAGKEAFQALYPVDQVMAVLPDKITLSVARREVDKALVPSLRNHYPIEPGQTVGGHLAGEFAGGYDLASPRPAPDSAGGRRPPCWRCQASSGRSACAGD
jgi:hypothetical protein